MSPFNIETIITPPHPEHGEYGFITLKSDLISFYSIISEGYKIAVLVDFQGLENKVVEEISNISDQSIDKNLFGKIPYMQIELDEETLNRHAEDVGKNLENRSGFYPQDGDFIKEEDGWGKYSNFKRYRVHFSKGSHVYLNTNIAFELASCMDAFNAAYREFKENYQKYVSCFNELKIGDIFFDSIREDVNKSFVKCDHNRAQYLDGSLELIQGSFKEFDNNYKVLNGSKKIDISAASIDKDISSQELLHGYSFLSLVEGGLKNLFLLALGITRISHKGSDRHL